MSAAANETGPATGRRARIALCAGLLAYALILSRFIGAVAGGSDNSGYFNEARLFAHLTVHAQPRVVAGLPPGDAPPYLYVPLGFRPATGGPSQIVPTYPPGLPILLVPVARIAGWRHAGDILLVLHSLAGLALTFALGRMCGLSPGWSLLGCAVLAASPLYLYTSLQALSDVPATAWAAAAVLAAWKSRGRAGWALASGVSFAVAVLIRPSNFLIALPMVIAFGVSPRRWLLSAAGAIPGIAAWMAINHAAYGGYLESGYGAIGNEFHASLIPGTLRYCARWLPNLFGPIVIVAPAVIALVRLLPRRVALLAAWAAAYVGFYSAYRWTHQDWWFLRFLLPAAPALIVSGLMVVNACLERLRTGAPRGVIKTFTVLLVTASLCAETVQILTLEAWTIGRGERKYGRVAEWLKANLPADSVVVANQFSGALYYFTDFTFLRADQIDGATAKRIQAVVQAAHRPMYAVTFPFEDDLIARIPCRWTMVRAVDDVLVRRCDWPDR